MNKRFLKLVLGASVALFCVQGSDLAMAQANPQPQLMEKKVEKNIKEMKSNRGERPVLKKNDEKKSDDKDVKAEQSAEVGAPMADSVQVKAPQKGVVPQARSEKREVKRAEIAEQLEAKKADRAEKKAQKMEIRAQKKEEKKAQKECRINRVACRQDCSAAKKACGKTKDCANELKNCKLACKKEFECR